MLIASVNGMVVNYFEKKTNKKIMKRINYKLNYNNIVSNNGRFKQKYNTLHYYISIDLKSKRQLILNFGMKFN